MEFKGLSRVFSLSAEKVPEAQMSSVGDVVRGLLLALGFCFHFVLKLGRVILAIDSSKSVLCDGSLPLLGRGPHSVFHQEDPRMSWVEGTTLI